MFSQTHKKLLNTLNSWKSPKNKNFKDWGLASADCLYKDKCAYTQNWAVWLEYNTIVLVYNAYLMLCVIW